MNLFFSEPDIWTELIFEQKCYVDLIGVARSVAYQMPDVYEI